MRANTLPAITAMSTALLAGGAVAQTNGTFLLTAWSTVSPSSPSTIIEIWASWDGPPGGHGFGGGDYDITAGDGVFSDPTNILNGPGSSPGVANGNTITGGINGELFIPGCGFPGCPRDTFVLLASYTWTATDFNPRTVDLDTSNTTNFILFDRATGRQIVLFPNEFTPGSGLINVVPAPSAWLVGAVPYAFASARRRRHPPGTGLAIGLAIGPAIGLGTGR